MLLRSVSLSSSNSEFWILFIHPHGTILHVLKITFKWYFVITEHTQLCALVTLVLRQKPLSMLIFFVLGLWLLWWNSMSKVKIWEEKVYLASTSTSLFVIGRSQDCNSRRAGIEGGADREVVEEWCLLTCSSWLFSLFFDKILDQQSSSGPTKNGLAFPRQLNSKTPLACHMAFGGIFSIVSPFRWL